MLCPRCQTNNIETARFCKICGSKIETGEPGPYTHLLPEAVTTGRDRDYSNAQVTWHLYPLMLLGGVYYMYYWFYRNWKYMKLTSDEKVQPVTRLMGLMSPMIVIAVLSFAQGMKIAVSKSKDTLFPFELFFLLIIPLYLVSLYFVYDQFKTVGDTARAAMLKSYSLSVVILGFAGFIYLPQAVNLTMTQYQIMRSPVAIFLFTLISLGAYAVAVCLLTKVQDVNNRLWLSHNPGARLRRKFSSGEIAVMAVFGSLQALGLIMSFLRIFVEALQ